MIDRDLRTRPARRTWAAIFALLVLAVFALGYWAAHWRAKVVDAELRAGLLQQAMGLTRTMDPARIKDLSFTAADQERPVFRLLREQIRGYQTMIPCRGIYTLAIRNGALVFGPESYAQGDPQASPPGTTYQQPTAEARAMFHTRRAFTEGPAADEYGTFVSAFAPVFDPESGEVLMVVGLDLEAADWQTTLTRARLEAVLCVLFPAAILLCGIFVLWRRAERPLEKQTGLGNAEIYLVAAFGLALTLVAALAFHEAETRSRRESFRHLAQAKADLALISFENLRDQKQETLVRFLRSALSVGREEDAPAMADLYQLQAGQSPRFLASSLPGHAAPYRADAPGQEAIHLHADIPALFPLFAFDKSYALAIHPTPAFLAANPLWAGGTAVPVGLLLTALLTAFAAFLLRRRADLEIQVHARTSQLAESEERYRDLVENIHDLICTHDLEGNILSVNRAALKLLGYESGEMIGKNIRDLLAPGARQEFDEYLTTIRREGAARGLMQAQSRSGEKRLWEYDNTLRTEGVPRPIVRGLARDITDRKQAEAAREKLEAELRQAQKMDAVGRLAGGVAHDFNNMLNIIIGYAGLALMKLDSSDPLQTHIQEIMTAAKRSADLVRQLLAFARRQTIAPRALELNDTVAGLLKMLQRLIGEDIDLRWKPGPDLWQVNSDPTQLDQILANLTVNARDAIAGVGKITIETDNMAFDEAYCQSHAGLIPGQYVLLAVSDDGCGMDKDIMAHLFEPFFTTKPVGEGTGLGLATVYGIVKQNGGFINVYSEPSKGSTFKIYLPRYCFEEAALETPKQAKAPVGTETVLLVEDEEALLEIGQIMLAHLGYEVLAAGSPIQALRLAEEYPGEIHLLLTDVVMPEMNGRDLWQRVSALRPGIKCLYMSGYTANVIAHRGVLDEGVHFLQKPFSLETMAGKVREALL
ncbi:MAG: PAS domain S-box protein [Smithellaceae bacterium]|nr:PAS domain S-box protein [Smithellaceae bacterium]